MKLLLFQSGKGCRSRSGFSLAESMFSIGVLSFGFLTLLPLLALGLKTARQARDERETAQIAQTLIEEAKQGTLVTGTAYLDDEGSPTSSTKAIYTATTTVQPLTPGSGNGLPSQLKIQVTPVGAPNNAQTYAVIYSAPQ